ncbi:MAG: helix-turn-helix transcriptional regulator [Kordiimonadaceae bacterium]|nr:helix-turn-helix transcriptional regulator [Kordiimonadaceae bacterium]
MIETLDTVFRNAAIGLFLFLGLLILRDFKFRLTSILGSLASFTGASYMMCSHPIFGTVFGPHGFTFGIGTLCIMGPVTVWLFSLSLFQDNFRLRPMHAVYVALYIAMNQVHFSYGENLSPDVRFLMEVAYAAVRIGFIAHMLYVAWQGRGDDLLEIRIRFRWIYIGLVGFAITAIFIFETYFTNEQLENPTALLVQSAGMAALAFTIMWTNIRLHKGILFEPAIQPKDEESISVSAQKGDASERHDLTAIMTAVVDDKKFLLPGLTISSLAAEVSIPEHRLRRLINRHMGYRNFADFLNHYRIDAAKLRLADAGERHTQVLVIAMDLGYGSLGPFNRAFKERTGQTPTEYRGISLAETG